MQNLSRIFGYWTRVQNLLQILQSSVPKRDGLTMSWPLGTGLKHTLNGGTRLGTVRLDPTEGIKIAQNFFINKIPVSKNFMT